MSPRSWLAPTLLTVMTLAVIDSMRFSGPLIDAAFEQSTGLAASVALITYAGVAIPVAILALTALKGRLLRATGISVILYVIARAAMQLFADSLYPAALAVTTIALASWVLCVATVRYAFSTRKTVSALLGGIALSVTSQLLLGTWDLAWRTDLLALVLITFGLMGLFLLGSFAITKQAAGPDITPSHVRVSQLWPLGPWLALVLMVFANPAFLASQSGYALGWSGAFLIGTAAVGLSLLSPEETAAAPVVAPVQSGWQRTIAALVGFVGGATAAFILDGVASFIAVIVALLSSIPLLLDVLASRERMRRGVPVDLEEEIPAPGIGVLTAAGLLIGLFTVLPVLLFQLDYDIPLPVPNYFVITAATAAVGLAALWAVWRRPQRSSAHAEDARAYAAYVAEMYDPDRVAQMMAAEVLGPSDGMRAGAASGRNRWLIQEAWRRSTTQDLVISPSVDDFVMRALPSPTVSASVGRSVPLGTDHIGGGFDLSGTLGGLDEDIRIAGEEFRYAVTQGERDAAQERLESLQKQRDEMTGAARLSGQEFASYVQSAGESLLGLFESIQSGSASGIISGVGGFASSLFGAIGGSLAAAVPWIGVGTSLLGGIAGLIQGNQGRQAEAERERQRAAGAQARGVSSFSINVVINSALQVESLTDQASRSAIRSYEEGLAERMLGAIERSLIPRIQNLESAVGV